jgi:hypothetical protein
MDNATSSSRDIGAGACSGARLFLQGQTQPALIALDRLLLLRELSNAANHHIRQAKISDLPNFFVSAEMARIMETYTAAHKNDEPDKANDVASKFTNEPLENSQIIYDVPMRMAVGGVCDVLVTRLSPGHELHLRIKGAVSVMSENIQFATFRDCEPGSHLDVNFLLLKIDDGQYAFALPKTWMAPFELPSWWFWQFDFNALLPSLSIFKEALPPLPHQLIQYFDTKSFREYVVLPQRDVDFTILNYAETHLGIHFAANKLEEAAYEKKESEASYFGITAPITFLVKIGPLIYFVLSIELWRRVRRLPSGRIVSDKYWFAFETRDWVGWTYSTLYSLLPLLLGLLIYGLFAISQNLGFPLFGRWWTLPGLFTSDFPIIFDATADYFAMVVAGMALLQLLISILTVRKLWQVVSINRREAIR